MDELVYHDKFGEGKVKKIKDGYIFIRFNDKERSFRFPEAFNLFLSTTDTALLKKIGKPNTSDNTATLIKSNTHNGGFLKNNNIGYECLIGKRAQTIDFNSKAEMFRVIGYIASKKRVSSFEAEVPKDGRDKVFETLFPGQKYRPIEIYDTPSGLPSKIGSQFRINFLNLFNCPNILKANMGKGNGSCVGRINKSKFVLDLVLFYGFKFGEVQDLSKIRNIAIEKGFLSEFEEGLRL